MKISHETMHLYASRFVIFFVVYGVKLGDGEWTLINCANLTNFSRFETIKRLNKTTTTDKRRIKKKHNRFVEFIIDYCSRSFIHYIKEREKEHKKKQTKFSVVIDMHSDLSATVLVRFSLQQKNWYYVFFFVSRFLSEFGEGWIILWVSIPELTVNCLFIVLF